MYFASKYLLLQTLKQYAHLCRSVICFAVLHHWTKICRIWDRVSFLDWGNERVCFCMCMCMSVYMNACLSLCVMLIRTTSAFSNLSSFMRASRKNFVSRWTGLFGTAAAPVHTERENASAHQRLYMVRCGVYRIRYKSYPATILIYYIVILWSKLEFTSTRRWSVRL